MIHVVLGTKAQYIKTAPLLRLMDETHVDYRLVDLGQHGELTKTLRQELAVRDPDMYLGGDADITTIPQAAVWAVKLAFFALNKRRVATEVFGRRPGVVVIHGDTPSTLLSMLLAKRVGLAVAHLEAGLTSNRLTRPFPEEAIRRVVMRYADILFTPDDTATAHLNLLAAKKRIRGVIVPLGANTGAEQLTLGAIRDDGPVVATMHRVENVTSKTRVAQFVQLLLEIVATRPVTLVTHGPTKRALAQQGADVQLAQAGVTLVDLLPHDTFVTLLTRAPFVITDGGSIQEECARIGVPTLLWRDATERGDGLNQNVVLSGYDNTTIETFLHRFDALRCPPQPLTTRPSRHALDTLIAYDTR